jgi:hypothetical protein
MQEPEGDAEPDRQAHRGDQVGIGGAEDVAEEQRLDPRRRLRR